MKRRLCRSLWDECHCATDDGYGSGERVTPSEPRDILRTRSSKQIRGYPSVEELRERLNLKGVVVLLLPLNESGLLAESSLYLPFILFLVGGPSKRDFFSPSLGEICVC